MKEMKEKEEREKKTKAVTCDRNGAAPARRNSIQSRNVTDVTSALWTRHALRSRSLPFPHIFLFRRDYKKSSYPEQKLEKNRKLTSHITSRLNHGQQRVLQPRPCPAKLLQCSWANAATKVRVPSLLRKDRRRNI